MAVCPAALVAERQAVHTAYAEACHSYALALVFQPGAVPDLLETVTTLQQRRAALDLLLASYDPQACGLPD